jgi:hypothetical protein
MLEMTIATIARGYAMAVKFFSKNEDGNSPQTGPQQALHSFGYIDYMIASMAVFSILLLCVYRPGICDFMHLKKLSITVLFPPDSRVIHISIKLKPFPAISR